MADDTSSEACPAARLANEARLLVDVYNDLDVHCQDETFEREAMTIIRDAIDLVMERTLYAKPRSPRGLAFMLAAVSHFADEIECSAHVDDGEGCKQAAGKIKNLVATATVYLRERDDLVMEDFAGKWFVAPTSPALKLEAAFDFAREHEAGAA